MKNEAGFAVQKLSSVDHGFSQEDIWHAARLWGCSDEQALRQLIDEEKRWAEDD